MLAAYFLSAQGPQKHGEGPLIDTYMRVLRWSLDARAADAARARGDRWKWLAYIKDHRLWVVGIGVLALFATIFSFSLLPMTRSEEHTSELQALMLISSYV